MENPKIIVVKCGGSVLNHGQELTSLCRNIQELNQQEFKVVVVHGGGPEISRLLKHFNLPSLFHNGLRVTTAAIAEIAQMALIGTNNTNLVRLLNKHGINACGLSGADSNLLVADYLDWENLGYVGEVTVVNVNLLNLLLSAGIVPLIAPLAVDESGNILNINADLAASAIATALSAHLVLLSDVDGYYAAYPDKNSRISMLHVSEVNCLLSEDGKVSSGMIPKLQACAKAVTGGVKSACILNGTEDYFISNALTQPGKYGTTIIKEMTSCKSE